MTLEGLRDWTESVALIFVIALTGTLILLLPDELLATTYYVDSHSSAGCSRTLSDHTSWATAADSITCIIGSKSISTGDVAIVRANGAGKGNSYSGFTMTDGVTVKAELTTAFPIIEGNVTFADGTTTAGSVLDGMEVLNGGASIYMSAKSATGINNNAIVRNCLITGGVKPGIKHEGGTPIVENNEITNKDRTGIRFTGPAGTSSQAMIIRGNNFHGNGLSGGGTKMYAEIHFEKSSDSRYVLIQNNLLHQNTASAGISIDESGDDTVYITGNEIYDNPWGGIRLGTVNDGSGTTHTGHITISGEQNFTFGGSSYTNGAPNKIHNNGRGGIAIGVGSTVDIIRNEIYNNGWGGIHTGMEEPLSAYTWPSAYGSAVLTIRKNKVYGNGTGTDTAGGGIDVMHASGTIDNNVVYGNKYAGIRIGGPNAGDAHITSITNNTVVSNGGGDTSTVTSAGGGIVYHDGTGGYDAMPAGTAPWKINVKNNVVAYSARGGLRGLGFTNTPGSEERDYNLLYANNYNAWWDANHGIGVDCDSVVKHRWLICVYRQYGGYGSTWGTPAVPSSYYLIDPNDIIADPLFVNMGANDYQLTTSSPGHNTGSDGSDRGAWGGSYPMDW